MTPLANPWRRSKIFAIGGTLRGDVGVWWLRATVCSAVGQEAVFPLLWAGGYSIYESPSTMVTPDPIMLRKA